MKKPHIKRTDVKSRTGPRICLKLAKKENKDYLMSLPPTMTHMTVELMDVARTQRTSHVPLTRPASEGQKTSTVVGWLGSRSPIKHPNAQNECPS